MNTTTNNKIIILSDNKIVSKELVNKIKNTYYYECDIQHTGQNMNTNQEYVKNSIIEFAMIFNSNNILSLSPYYHGSGFSLWPAIMNNIKYTSIYIGD